jgi:glycerate 2-kinase
VTPLAELARSMFAAAVAAVQPTGLMRRLTFSDRGVAFEDAVLEPSGRLVLAAIGKAAPGLAKAFLTRTRRMPDVVFVLAPDGVPVAEELLPATRRASHPLPDQRGEAGTAELLALVSSLAAQDGVVLLLSGGGSALLAQPLEGMRRSDVTSLTGALLAAGADIHELNAVRKHLLAAAGGRLAAACPAALLTLAISDVPGDDLATIASGPTVADPTTFAEALTVLRRRALVAGFPNVVAFLERGAGGTLPESPKRGDGTLARSRARLLGSSREALAAAAQVAREAGFSVLEVTRRMRGEARELGVCLAGLAASAGKGDATTLLFAGETTVTVRGRGRGGRNLEVALGAALAMVGGAERCILAAGTDGVDGAAPAAGAVVDGNTVGRGLRRGRNAAAALAENDSWGFFEDLEEAIVTGPTGTNVADLAFVLVQGRPRAYLPRGEVRLESLTSVPL